MELEISNLKSKVNQFTISVLILVQAISMQPDERRIIILDEIPGQDESDASTSTKGRRTNRSSISQLPKGSAGRTRQQASARPATSLTCPSEPQDPGQGGHESTTSAVLRNIHIVTYIV